MVPIRGEPKAGPEGVEPIILSRLQNAKDWHPTTYKLSALTESI